MGYRLFQSKRAAELGRSVRLNKVSCQKGTTGGLTFCRAATRSESLGKDRFSDSSWIVPACPVDSAVQDYGRLPYDAILARPLGAIQRLIGLVDEFASG